MIEPEPEEPDIPVTAFGAERGMLRLFFNIGSKDVITFSQAGQVVRTEQAAESGNDGVVVLPDGTKYVSSVRFGSVSRIRRNQPAEVIATGIPSAASMCYDSRQNQLVIPLNPNNALAFIPLGRR